MPHFFELYSHYRSMEIKLLRGTAPEVAELLKTGQAELAIAASLGDTWDRLDNWPLFTERFELIADSAHRFATRDTITVLGVEPGAAVDTRALRAFEPLGEPVEKSGARC